jgi:hypothetical protein
LKLRGGSAKSSIRPILRLSNDAVAATNTLKAVIRSGRWTLSWIGRRDRRPALCGASRSCGKITGRIFVGDFLVLRSALSLVSVDPSGSHDYSIRYAGTVASGRLSLLLALEVSPGGRPPIDAELRALIRQISRENLLWGAPGIHGELLKLGFELELIDPLTRMRRSLARYSAPVSFVRVLSWADFITIMVGFRVSVHTPPGLPKDPTLFGRFTLGQAESIHGRRGLRPGESQPTRRSERLDAAIGTIRSVLDAGETS